MNTDEIKVEDLFGEVLGHNTEPGYNRDQIFKLTEIVIGCAYTVSNTLGCGFLEKVYENALVIELRKKGLHVAQQHPMEVLYDDVIVGVYLADVLVENVLVVEIKALSALSDAHKAQILNYLKATGLQVGLLLNFGRPRVEVKRAAL